MSEIKVQPFCLYLYFEICDGGHFALVGASPGLVLERQRLCAGKHLIDGYGKWLASLLLLLLLLLLLMLRRLLLLLGWLHQEGLLMALYADIFGGG